MKPVETTAEVPKRNVYSPEQEVGTITLEVKVPAGVDPEEWRVKCRQAIEGWFNLQAWSDEQQERINKRLDLLHSTAILESDAALETWVREVWSKDNGSPAIGRACWYRRIEYCQNRIYIDHERYSCKDRRRPVFMKGSVEVLTYGGGLEWALAVIRRYMRRTKYTSNNEESIMDHIATLLQRVVVPKNGWRKKLWSTDVRWFDEFGEPYKDLAYAWLAATDGVKWVNGEREKLSEGEQELRALERARSRALDARDHRSVAASDRAFDLTMQLGKLEKHIYGSQIKRVDAEAD